MNASMKLAIVGKQADIIIPSLKKAGFTIVDKNPDMVISFGGDGTSLYADQRYPGVPRVLIRHSKICNTCQDHDYTTIIRAIKDKRYIIVSYTKVQALLNGKKTGLIGLNEIDIHHLVPHAIRLSLSINGVLMHETVIGDGIIVATPHGSTGYFTSITRKIFGKGLGIAFNNAVNELKPLYINEDDTVEIKV